MRSISIINLSPPPRVSLFVFHVSSTGPLIAFIMTDVFPHFSLRSLTSSSLVILPPAAWFVFLGVFDHHLRNGSMPRQILNFSCLFWKCNFPLKSHVCRLVNRLVGWFLRHHRSDFHNYQKRAWKLNFHAPIGALVFYMLGVVDDGG